MLNRYTGPPQADYIYIHVNSKDMSDSNLDKCVFPNAFFIFFYDVDLRTNNYFLFVMHK